MSKRQGAYHYFCDGLRMAEETWSIETDAAGNQMIVSSRDASQFGAYFAVEALIKPDHNEDYRFEFAASRDGPVLKTAHYRVLEQKIWRVSDTGQTTAIDVESGAMFFPLMRIFTGRMIVAMSRRHEPVVWVVPNIASPKDHHTLFEPDIGRREIVPDPTDPQVFFLTGGPYAAPARLRLRADGLLDNYCFTPKESEQIWECRYVSTEP